VTALSIAVVGAGAIGSGFAFRLARAGHDVTVVARPGSARLQQLARDRGVIDKADLHAEMRVVDQLDAEVAYDLVLVTTLAHQVDVVLPALRASKARCIQFMFNTFDPERLRDAVDPDRCSFGMPFIMATLDGEGRLTSSVSAARKTLHSDRRWVDLFQSAGIPSAFDADMLLWLRCHAPMCVAMEAISVAGQRRGGGASWSQAMVVARGLRGGLAIVRGLGYRLYPPAKAALFARPTVLVAAMLWSVSRIKSFRELLATGVNECRALADVIVAAAAEVQPRLPTAVNAVVAMKPAEQGMSARPGPEVLRP